MQNLWTGLSALNASTNWMSQLSGNISNINTVGYGDTEGSFEDMITTHMSGNATAPTEAGRYTQPGSWDGTGVLSAQMETNFDGIGIKKTGSNLDFALTGADQFFTVQNANGQTVYTKAGNFQLSENANGTADLVTSSGQNVLDVTGKPIVIPKGVTNITVNQDGQISYGNTQSQKIGVAQVGTPSQFLSSTGDNSYVLDKGGQARIANAQNGSTVDVMQGYLDTNNVDMSSELSRIIEAQNMYEVNAKAINISNQMMQIDNKIHP